MNVGDVPEGAPFRLIRCALNYDNCFPVEFARTYRAGPKAKYARKCYDAGDGCAMFSVSQPVVLVTTVGRLQWAELR